MGRMSADRVVSLTAIIVSLGTLFTIVYQTQLIRKQQYASVLPYIEMWNSNRGDSYSYMLFNNGIGPAFVKEVKVHYGDSTVVGDLAFFTYHVIKPVDSVKNYSYSNIKAGGLIPAGKKIDLISVSNDSVNAAILRKWFSKGDHIQVEVIYESVYKERWSARGMATEPVRLN